MSWTRAHDDEDAYLLEIAQSQNVLAHHADPTMKVAPSCFTTQVGYETQNVHGYDGVRVAAESELRGLSRHLSNVNQEQFPFVQQTPAIPDQNMCGPEQMLLTEHTRFAMPLLKREQSTMRFDPLSFDPQQLDKIHPTYYHGVNTRSLEKDAYRLIKPTPLFQTNVISESFCGCGL